MKGPPSFELNASDGVAAPSINTTAVAAAAANFEIELVMPVILLSFVIRSGTALGPDSSSSIAGRNPAADMRQIVSAALSDNGAMSKWTIRHRRTIRRSRRSQAPDDARWAATSQFR